MRTDENNSSHIMAEDGKVLQRMSDGAVVGREIWLGYTYYLGGEKLDEPLLELPEHFREIDAPQEDDDPVITDEKPMVEEPAEDATADAEGGGDGTDSPTVITAGDIRALQQRVAELEERLAKVTGVAVDFDSDRKEPVADGRAANAEGPGDAETN